MATGKPAVYGGIAAWVDRLQAAGRYTFAREDLVGLAGHSPVAIDAASSRRWSPDGPALLQHSKLLV